MAFLILTVDLIWYTIQLLDRPMHDSSESSNSLEWMEHTSVTNSWIVYQIESTVEVKKATINIPGCGWAAKTKGYRKCTRLLGNRSA